MKNKVYIDYGHGNIFWSIEEVKNNFDTLKDIIKSLSDSTLLKLKHNEITIDEVINMTFSKPYQIRYQLVETDSDTIYIDLNSSYAYSNFKEALDHYDDKDILEYALNLYNNNVEKLFSAIAHKEIDFEQVAKDCFQDMDIIAVNKTTYQEK